MRRHPDRPLAGLHVVPPHLPVFRRELECHSVHAVETRKQVGNEFVMLHRAPTPTISIRNGHRFGSQRIESSHPALFLAHLMHRTDYYTEDEEMGMYDVKVDMWVVEVVTDGLHLKVQVGVHLSYND